MLHNHSAFEAANPDAAQALEDALPFVAQLLELGRLPQPKNPDDLCALREQIGDAEGEIARIADRGGVEAQALRATAERQLRRAAARPAPVAPGEGAAPTAESTFSALAVENARLSAEIASLERDGARIARDLKARRAAQRKVHRRLFTRGRKLG